MSGFGAATFTGRRLCTGGCRKSACRRSTAVTMAFAPTSRSAAHTARAHRHTPAAPDDRRRNRHPDRVVPVHPGDVGGQRRLADKYMVSTHKIALIYDMFSQELHFIFVPQIV